MKRKKLLSVIMAGLLLVCVCGGCAKGGGEDYPYPTLAPDWSNWADGSMPGAYGGWLNLWKSNDRNEKNFTDIVAKNVMLDGKVITKDGALDVFLNYSFTVGEYKGEETMNAVIVVTVNDEICDFTLNGQKSENGLLVTEKSMGEEHTEKLSIKDCGLFKGDNELAVHMAVYFPSGHTTATSISRTFVSEVERNSGVDYGYDVSKLTGSEIVTSDGKDEREINHWLGTTRDFTYEKLSFDSTKRCITVAADSDIKMSFPNKRGETGAVARQAMVLVLKNGQPMGVWDGKMIGELDLGKADLCVTLPITMEKKAEEYAHLTFVFFDEKYDVGTFVTEGLFQFQ